MIDKNLFKKYIDEVDETNYENLHNFIVGLQEVYNVKLDNLEGVVDSSVYETKISSLLSEFEKNGFFTNFEAEKKEQENKILEQEQEIENLKEKIIILAGENEELKSNKLKRLDEFPKRTLAKENLVESPISQPIQNIVESPISQPIQNTVELSKDNWTIVKETLLKHFDNQTVEHQLEVKKIVEKEKVLNIPEEQFNEVKEGFISEIIKVIKGNIEQENSVQTNPVTNSNVEEENEKKDDLETYI